MNIDGLATDFKELPAKSDNSCGAQTVPTSFRFGRFSVFVFEVKSVELMHGLANWVSEAPNFLETSDEKVLYFLGLEFETAAKKVGLVCELTRCSFHRAMDQGG